MNFKKLLLNLLKLCFPKIFRTLVYNKMDTSKIEGIQLKYSFILALNGSILFVVIIVFSISLILDSLNSIKYCLVGITGLLFFGYLLQDYISRLLFKNPILILDKNRLYYIYTNQWYDIMDFEFENEIKDSTNTIPKSYFQMINKKTGERIFHLRNWYLFDEESFKTVLHNRRYRPISN